MNISSASKAGPREIATRWAALALALSACLLGTSTRAQASTEAAGSGTAVQVHQNIYTAGGHVRPAAPVPGDFVAAGGRVVLDQPVAGDASLAGGSVEVLQPVGGDLRVGGGDVRIDSVIGGELRAAGGNVSLAPGTRVEGEAHLYGADVAVRGRIGQELTARGRHVLIDAQVAGDARVWAETLELGPQARIAGALHYVGRAGIKRADGAVVGGAVTREEAPRQAPRAASEGAAAQEPRAGAQRGSAHAARDFAMVFGAVVLFLGQLAFAAVLLAVAPRWVAATADRIRSAPVSSLAVGFATVLAVPVLAGLLFVTLIGIPLGVLVLSLLPVALLGGLLLGVLFIARLLRGALRRRPAGPVGFGVDMLFAGLALLIVMLVAGIPVAGPLMVGLLVLVGLGGAVLGVKRRGSSTRS